MTENSNHRSSVLARLDLSENRVEAAAESLQAARLDPGNLEVQRLQSALAAKLAEKAQPLPKP